MEDDQDSDENGQDLEPEESSDLSLQLGNSLAADQRSARVALKGIVTGRKIAKPGQMAAIKMLLQNELEPEKAPNPYTGQSEDELAERMIVTACSVLGIKRLTEVLMQLAKLGEADVLKGMEAFESEAGITALTTDAEPLRETRKTGADEGPQELPS